MEMNDEGKENEEIEKEVMKYLKNAKSMMRRVADTLSYLLTIKDEKEKIKKEMDALQILPLHLPYTHPANLNIKLTEIDIDQLKEAEKNLSILADPEVHIKLLESNRYEIGKIIESLEKKEIPENIKRGIEYIFKKIDKGVAYLQKYYEEVKTKKDISDESMNKERYFLGHIQSFLSHCSEIPPEKDENYICYPGVLPISCREGFLPEFVIKVKDENNGPLKYLVNAMRTFMEICGYKSKDHYCMYQKIINEIEEIKSSKSHSA